MKAQVRAFAKINLVLLVGPRRPDGYHELASLMAPIDLADDIDLDLRFNVAAPGEGRASRVRVTCPGVKAGQNIIDRVVGLLEAETGWQLAGSIVVRKRIPLAAGLGGGSADAAAVLVAALDALRQAGARGVSESGKAIELAASLGSDVPFFTEPGAGLVRGRGEKREPFFLPQIPVCLVMPDEELATARVYQAFDEFCGGEDLGSFLGRAECVIAGLREAEQEWSDAPAADPVRLVIDRLAPFLHNDLEEPAFRLLPSLSERKAALEACGARAVRMSGSGPTMFGLFESLSAARKAADSLRRQGLRALATQTL